MKTFIVILVIVLAAVGAYWFFDNQQSGDIPQDQDSGNVIDDTNNDEMMNDHGDVRMEGDDTVPHDDSMMEGENTPTDSMEMHPETKTYDITGKNFEFSTKEIRVNEGDTVVINFSSEMGFHDWSIDEFNAKTSQVNPGTSTSVTFVANKKGTFEYYCSVGNHRAMGMVGNLIIE